MKSAVVAATLLAAALAVTPFVRGSDASDRPPGVAKEAWIQINERVGFVLVPPGKGPLAVPPQALMLTPPVSGYFMLKSAAGRNRVIIVEPLRGPAGAG
jgi:hypothetical protein